jgi:Ankyrin repeats (3 copies)
MENVMRMIATTLMAGMLAATANAQVPDFTPQTPLIGTLLHNDAAEAKRLLEQGADPNEGRFIGMAPIILAIARQDLELVRLMAAKGADLTVRDRSGSTLLMWAAFSETGDAAVVEELLRRGADLSATNQAGETALDWALRRGDTPAVAALRKAGANDTATMKASIEKSIALLQTSSAQFNKVAGCSSCHHQLLPQTALGAARSRGLPIDEAAAQHQLEVTVGILKRVYEQARANRDRIPDPPISVSYTLLALAAESYKPDDITDAMVQMIGAWQSGDGAFHPLPSMRPPMESNSFTATALSIRAIQLYGAGQDDRVARASKWLRTATPRTTEERAMQLLGLAWVKAPADDIRRSANALLAAQRQDGGWAQLPALETDAYATGQALVALQTAGHAVTSSEYQRGVDFLLRTQFPDGSWLVRTRTYPVQPLRDSGFPHGKHQWISAAGTSWATLALALALPPKSSSAATYP